MKIYLVDIDGMIANTDGIDYENSKPDREMIEKLNSEYEKGEYIKIFTGRGSKTGLDLRDLTERQLQEWGVKYHELIFGKPDCDIILDDKAVNKEEWLKLWS